MRLALKIAIVLALALPAKGEDLFNDLPGGNQDIHNMAVKCRSMSGLYHSIEPIISVPAVIGFEQKKTAIGDFCDMVMTMDQYHTRLKDLQQKLQLNDLTAERTARYLALHAMLFSDSYSPVDPNSAEGTAAEAVKRRKKRKFGAFYRRTTGISLETASMSTETASQAERNSDMMSRLSTLASQRAKLHSKLTCKTGENSLLKGKYERELERLQEQFEYADDLREYYYDQLRAIGSQLAREKKLSDYHKELKVVHKTAFELIPKDTTISETTYIKKENKKTGEYDKVPVKKDFPIQTFSVKKKSEVIDGFLEKWSRTWRDDLKVYGDSMLTQAEAIARYDRKLNDTARKDDPLLRAESLGNLTQALGKDRNRNKQFSRKYAINLFDEYWAGYRKNLEIVANLEAEMLTKESEMLRQPLFVTPEQRRAIVQADPIVCKEDLTPAEMDKLKAFDAAASAEFRQVYLENQMKRTKLLEENRERRARKEADRNIMSNIVNKQSEEDKRGTSRIPRAGSY
nr:hypothetical protein BdHM001_35180 [Bdellovibrio sp. HM001]